MWYAWYCRAYQLAFRIGAYALPWRKPKVMRGQGSSATIAAVLKEKNIARVLLVTDAGIVSLGLEQPLATALRAQGLSVYVYDETVPNPTIANVEEALALYHTKRCQALVAVGGGSPMDCAKGMGARLARPGKRIQQLKGQLKVWRKIPLLVAVPTTSGTGSETTLAAVLTDGATHEKFAINDPALIPHYAVLDPELTRAMPPHITATTGIDALTHAVEAYIGRSNTVQTRRDALEATRLIFENIQRAYADGEDMQAREHMQEASFLAGAAFTRAYVGNVHAIAHTLGGQYGTPHGLANAVILPYVLDAYGASAHRALAELAAAAGIGSEGMTQAQRAQKFIEAVRALNRRMNIPEKIEDLCTGDIDVLASRALKEANPLYPVPVIFDRARMVGIYRQLLAGMVTEGRASA